MITEDNYAFMPTTDKQLVLAIPSQDGFPADTHFLYAGGDEAILVRSGEKILFNQFSSDIKKHLKGLSNIFVTEIDYIGQKLDHDYQIPVELVSKLPN